MNVRIKQMEKTEVQIDDMIFYISPFSAYDSTVIFGDLVSIIGPVISGLTPIFDMIDDEKGVFDMEFSEVAPALSSALVGISGEKMAKLIKELLLDKRKITFSYVGEDKVEYLNMDNYNEMFCQDILGVYQLCFEVVKLNYGSFFTKISTRFGKLGEVLKDSIQKSTEPLT